MRASRRMLGEAEVMAEAGEGRTHGAAAGAEGRGGEGHGGERRSSDGRRGGEVRGGGGWRGGERRGKGTGKEADDGTSKSSESSSRRAFRR